MSQNMQKQNFTTFDWINGIIGIKEYESVVFKVYCCLIVRCQKSSELTNQILTRQKSKKTLIYTRWTQ